MVGLPLPLQLLSLSLETLTTGPCRRLPWVAVESATTSTEWANLSAMTVSAGCS